MFDMKKITAYALVTVSIFLVAKTVAVLIGINHASDVMRESREGGVLIDTNKYKVSSPMVDWFLTRPVGTPVTELIGHPHFNVEMS